MRSSRDELFSMLPQEITTLIFSFLDILSLARVKEVDKKFHEIATQDKIWQSLFEKSQAKKEGVFNNSLLPYLGNMKKDDKSEIEVALRKFFYEIFDDELYESYQIYDFHKLIEKSKLFFRNNINKNSDLNGYESYIRNLTEEKILSVLQENYKISFAKFDREDDKNIKYSFQKKLISIFLLKKMEGVVVFIYALNILNRKTEDGSYSIRYIHIQMRRCENFLTSKGIAFILTNQPISNVIFEIARWKIDNRPISIENRDFYNNILSQWLKEIDETDVRYVNKNFGSYYIPILILSDSKLNQCISNQLFLELVIQCLHCHLGALIALFKNDMFAKRLMEFPNYRLIVKGLMNEELEYDGRVISVTVKRIELNEQQKYVATSILHSSLLVQDMTDQDLLFYCSLSLKEYSDSILNSNSILVDRIAADMWLMNQIINQNPKWIPLFAKYLPKSKFFTLKQFYFLACFLDKSAATTLFNNAKILFDSYDSYQSVAFDSTEGPLFRAMKKHEDFYRNINQKKLKSKNGEIEKATAIATVDQTATEAGVANLASKEVSPEETVSHQIQSGVNPKHSEAVEYAEKFLRLGRTQHVAFQRLVIPICSGYLKQGKYEEAKKWYDLQRQDFSIQEEYQQYHREELRKQGASYLAFKLPLAIDLIKTHEDLPDYCVYLKKKFQDTFVAKNNWDDASAINFMCEATYVKWLNTEFKEDFIKKIINQFREHSRFIRIRKESSMEAQNSRIVVIYENRLNALNELIKDLKGDIENYTKNLYSDLNTERNDKALSVTLKQTIERHLNKEDSALKNHAGSKPIIYGVLSGLGWLLAPSSMVYHAVTSGHAFFQARNTTEDFLSEELELNFNEHILGNFS